jgi:hypothetical protein
VIAPVDFDDETSGRRAEVRDVATDDELSAKGNAEAAATQPCPEARFGSREMLPATGELVLPLRRRTTLRR